MQEKSGLEAFRVKTNEHNNIKKVIAVASGKGGVGKSLITGLTAVMLRRKGYNVGILDADVTGPSIPKMFGINQKASGNEHGMLPLSTTNDIKVMSINLLVDKTDQPVIWRGPIISGTVRQFWSDVIWGDIDVLLLDMPPGTGDIPLTVFQSIPLDGLIVVTTPQDLVSMVVKKAYNMAKAMNVPVIGMVENMSYVECPHCGEKIELFGQSKVEKVAQEMGVELLGRVPIDTIIAELCDKGEIEKVDKDYLSNAIEYVERYIKER